MGRLISDQSLAGVPGVALTAQDSQVGRLCGRNADGIRADPEPPLRAQVPACGGAVSTAPGRSICTRWTRWPPGPCQ